MRVDHANHAKGYDAANRLIGNVPTSLQFAWVKMLMVALMKIVAIQTAAVWRFIITYLQWAYVSRH